MAKQKTKSNAKENQINVEQNKNIFADTDKKTSTIGRFLTKNYKPAGYLIDGLLSDTGVSILAGSPGVGKSWIALEAAKSVSRGEPFLGKFKTRKSPVYIVEVDDLPSVFQHRARLLDIRANDDIYIWDHPTFQIRVDEGMEEMIEGFINHLFNLKVGLIIFDTFRNIHSADENSSEDMVQILKILKTISLRCNCTVLLLHHEKKAGPGYVKNTDKMRGSNSIEAEANTILQLSQDKANKAIKVSQTKNKLGPLAKDSYFTIDQDEAGEKINLKLVEVAPKIDPASTSNEILAFYEANPDPGLSMDEAVKQIAMEKHLSMNATKQAFKQLVAETRLQIKPGKVLKNKKIYVLAPSDIS